jgi:hypothetical protein
VAKSTKGEIKFEIIGKKKGSKEIEEYESGVPIKI